MPPGTLTFRPSPKRTVPGGSVACEGTSAGRRPTSSARSAIFIERCPNRTEENVAAASTSVPPAVAKRQSPASRPSAQECAGHALNLRMPLRAEAIDQASHTTRSGGLRRLGDPRYWPMGAEPPCFVGQDRLGVAGPPASALRDQQHSHERAHFTRRESADRQ